MIIAVISQFYWAWGVVVHYALSQNRFVNKWVIIIVSQTCLSLIILCEHDLYSFPSKSTNVFAQNHIVFVNEMYSFEFRDSGYMHMLQ